MTKYSIYLIFVIVCLGKLTPQVKSQTSTTGASSSEKIISTIDTESSTTPEISTVANDNTKSSTTVATKNMSTSTTKRYTRWTRHGIYPLPIRECGCNEHLGYICGCGERCPLPARFGPGIACPQHCIDNLTCVCNKGYGRDDKTKLCVVCAEYIYK